MTLPRRPLGRTGEDVILLGPGGEHFMHLRPEPLRSGSHPRRAERGDHLL